MPEKTLHTLVCIVSIALSAGAQEHGTPIFQDSFDTPATFAEKWVVKGAAKSADGKVQLDGSFIQMRRDTPEEFRAEIELTTDGTRLHGKNSGFCGFEIEGFLFTITHDGNFWVAKSPKEAAGTGVGGKIKGFTPGYPVKITLVRKKNADTAKYMFYVNGEEAATRNFQLVPQGDGKFSPLKITCYNLKATADSFGLFMLKQGEDDSPNLVFNSGFEHVFGDAPPYYSTAIFSPRAMIGRPYEDFINTSMLDDKEKYSGKYSMKLTYNGTTEHGGKGIRPWGVGTVKDAAGVFSVWMKAERDDFPVKIRYGGPWKAVKVSKEWQRYEVVNPKLPAPGVYSPAEIIVAEQGTVWIDDLQAEFIAAPSPDELKSGKAFATPYKPSELDKSRFGKNAKTTEVRTPPIDIPALPSGVFPGADLDAWKDKAVKVDRFLLIGGKSGTVKTEAYLACDKKNLYIGYRAFVKDIAKTDGKRDFVEMLADPTASSRKFNNFQFYSHLDGSCSDKGTGMDESWKGDWKSSVKLNEKEKSIDTLLTFPFSDFASPELKLRWIMNLHRTDACTTEASTLIESKQPSFCNPQLWPFTIFPEEIIKPYAIGAASAGYTSDSIILDFANKSGKVRKVTAEITDTDDGKQALKHEFSLQPDVKTSVAFPMQVKNPKVKVRLYENGELLSNQLVMLEKRAPASMLGRLSFYMNEPEAAFRIKSILPDTDKMTAVLTCGDVTVRQKAAPSFTFSLPLKEIADGTHKVTLTLEKDGKAVTQCSSELAKRPYKDGASQVNHFSRSLLHNGKPVVPFAPFQCIMSSWGMTEADVDGYIDLLSRYGFKYAFILPEKGRTKELKTKSDALTRYFLEQAERKGIKILLWMKYMDYTDEECAESRKTLDLPCVISQMVLDEPELGIPSDVSLAFLRKMRALFPYHPTHMNNTVLGIPRRYANLETDILMLDDYLTNQENRTVQSVVGQTDVMWNAGAADGKPCWYVIVGNNTSLHYREPTYAEQIAQTYGCLAAGCSGFSFYGGWPATNGNWKAYLQLNMEIQALTDVLCSEEECANVLASGNSELLRVRTKKHDGYLYVITCDIDENPAEKVTFTLPSEYLYESGFFSGTKTEVMFEDREIGVKDGKFTDDFAGHERHVYRIKLK